MENELEKFNKYINDLIDFFNGKKTEEEINIRPISSEVDQEMQRDSFY